MIDEDEIAILYFMDLVNAGSLAILISCQLGAQEISQPLNSNG
jgi:hypothetical protein